MTAKADEFVFPSGATSSSLTPEVLVPRLGDRLVEKDLLSREQLAQALAYQKTEGQAGKQLLLGEALLDLKFIDRPTLDQTITEQIAQLQDALKKSNEQLERRVEERTQELQEALEKLTELNRLKSDFIANMSHELRTPLAHMVGYIDLLDEEALGPLSDEQRRAVDVLKKSYLRLGSLIDNLLFLSFDSEEALPLQPQATPLNPLVENIVQRSQKKALDAEIELLQSVPRSLPSVYIDPEKLDWALTQLVDNSIKFNSKGGKVQIAAREVDGRVEMSVSDSGIGIAENKIHEIFEPFYQIDGSSTRKYGGAGLGLTLAKRIIDSHGAKLSIESHAGKGTRISFSLPLAKG
ncbi:MAG: HAMP domain-containing sensor histidine kinase [Chloroflexi bacterium]|nr:HAMP domain-containing sensor histidine kinase [Chloroflexota bacterium]